MAIYHFHVTQLSRGKGQTAISAAAYRAGEKLHDDYYGEEADYSRKTGVLFKEIMLPELAPKEYSDREMLWNAVEIAEANKKAQLAYSFDFALPNELSDEENIELARAFIKENFVKRGMICDVAVHKPSRDPNDIQNPHVYVLAPMRPMNPDGSWGTKQRREYVLDADGNRVKGADGKYLFNAVRTTDWGDVSTLETWRENWAKSINAALDKKGITERVDHRSNIDRGLEALPTIHEGPAVREMEKRGIRTELGEWNRYVRSINQSITNLLELIKSIMDAIAELSVEHREEKQAAEAFAKAVTGYIDRESSKYSGVKVRAKVMTETFSFMERHHIHSLGDFEKTVSELYDSVASSRHEMRNLDERKKTVVDLLDKYATLKRTEAVYKEWYGIKNPKKKTAFKESHEGELMQYHMAQRILMEAYPDMKIPVRKLKAELELLEKELREKSPELKKLKEEANLAYRLKCRIVDEYNKENQRTKKREERSL